MLDIRFIRENPEVVKEAMRKKKLWTVDIDDLLYYDRLCNLTLDTVENWRAQINKASKEFPKLSAEEKIELKEQVKWYKEELAFDEASHKEYEKQFIKLMLLVPNIPLDIVPEGDGDDDNVVIRVWPPVDGLELPIRAGDMCNLTRE